MHVQTLVCDSTRATTSLAWNYNSGTHYHVERGTLGCITDIKEQFHYLVYVLKPSAMKTNLDPHSESCCRHSSCPEGQAAARGGKALCSNFCFGEPILTAASASLGRGARFSTLVLSSWKVCHAQELRVTLWAAGGLRHY